MKTLMTERDIDLLERETRYEGIFRVERWRLRHRRFDGDWSPPFDREIFQRGHAAAIVLYDADRDLLVLIEQFRIGALAAAEAPETEGDIEPWMIEIVAGIIDDGETAAIVARRESEEEAGVTVTDLEMVGRFVLSPGVCSETIALYCGRVVAPDVGGIHGLAHEHEDIKVHLVPPADVFRWLDEGRITNATALVGLLWFRLNHDRIRQHWRAKPVTG
jgi:ADP-ribose pyrophosphatase